MPLTLPPPSFVQACINTSPLNVHMDDVYTPAPSSDYTMTNIELREHIRQVEAFVNMTHEHWMILIWLIC